MLTKITHVTLFVDNQDQALDFFVNKLGFEVHTDSKWDGFRWLTLNAQKQKDFELILYPAATPTQKALVGKQSDDVPILSIETDNCQEDYLKLKKNGVIFTQEPMVKPWGVNAIFKDLYGNIYNLVQQNS